MTREAIQHLLWRAQPRGQVIVLLAVGLIALIGMLGLAIDLGYLFSQKRAMQNAADAGALAGARMLTKSTMDVRIPVRDEVALVVGQNEFGGVTPVLEACQYVDASDIPMGDCGMAPPDGAAGVQVRVSENHSTFFVHVVPGAPNTLSTGANATARAFKVTNASGNGPFIVCGVDTKTVSGGNGQGGGTLSILLPDGTINPDAIGVTFLVHGPQVAGCGTTSGEFKGLADQEANRGKGLGDWFSNDNGNKVGPTEQKLNGIDGCDVGASGDFNCVMILPIATNNPPAVSMPPNYRFMIVAFGVFRVTSCKSPCQHAATLLGNYIIGPGDPGDGWLPDPTDNWQIGDDGLIMIRLVD